MVVEVCRGEVAGFEGLADGADRFGDVGLEDLIDIRGFVVAIDEKIVACDESIEGDESWRVVEGEGFHVERIGDDQSIKFKLAP